MEIKTTKVEYSSYPNNEWLVDFDSESTLEPASTLQTIIQSIRFTLETERYKYPIMGANYGVVFEDLIGTDYSFIKSEIASRIRDALSVDDRIISVDDFNFTNPNGSDMLVTFSVLTILGTATVSTTIIM
jgi:hypothetical protein